MVNLIPSIEVFLWGEAIVLVILLIYKVIDNLEEDEC